MCLRCGYVVGITTKVCEKCGYEFREDYVKEIWMQQDKPLSLTDKEGLPIHSLEPYETLKDGTEKRCPVCDKMVLIDAQFCDHCHWEFTYYRCYRCMHLFHPTDKIHIQGDELICPFCDVNLRTQEPEKHVSSNVKIVLSALGVALVLCVSYVYYKWRGELIPSDISGLASVGVGIVTALFLIYGYLKWRTRARHSKDIN